MKTVAVALVLTTVLALPVYANTAHSRHTAMSNNHARGHIAVIRNSRVFLLENRGAGTMNQVPNFQDNFAIDY